MISKELQMLGEPIRFEQEEKSAPGALLGPREMSELSPKSDPKLTLLSDDAHFLFRLDRRQCWLRLRDSDAKDRPSRSIGSALDAFALRERLLDERSTSL
jgi:hypothetical protein